MKKLTIIPFLLIISTFAFSQATEGKITYKYTIFWDKIYAKLDFLSQSEKDRIKLTRNNEEGYTTNMPLFFSSTASLYTYSEESENESTYSWRKDDYLIYRDFGEKKVKELQEMLGKTYLIEDELNPYKWRVMNELKEIQGHYMYKSHHRRYG
jgi:GLPGLI family protein